MLEHLEALRQSYRVEAYSARNQAHTSHHTVTQEAHPTTLQLSHPPDQIRAGLEATAPGLIFLGLAHNFKNFKVENNISTRT
jgi:hypothetical protein